MIRSEKSRREIWQNIGMLHAEGWRAEKSWKDIQAAMPPQDNSLRFPTSIAQQYSALTTALANVLRVDDASHPKVQKWLAHLSLVPISLHERLTEAGLREVHFANSGVPQLDNLQHLAGTKPRGWSAGSVWDHVEGAYSRSERVVVAGNALSGSVSTVLHE